MPSFTFRLSARERETPFTVAGPATTCEAIVTCRHRLRRHGVDVGLCVTELVTNVIDHLGEGTPVTVRVAAVDTHTRVEVTDPDPRALPVLVHSTVTDECGRGLALVAAVALRWGVDQGAGRKTVWCEVAAPAARPSCADYADYLA